MSTTFHTEAVLEPPREAGFSSPGSARGEESSRATADWMARAAIIAVAIELAVHTWGHWGNFQIDNGREIYVPVAILQGKLLFRDVVYMYGPLAPYLQALLLRIFGIHLSVLYGFGLALTIGSALLTFEIGRELQLEVFPAAVPPLILLMQAFTPFIFNLVFPYSYAASLAVFLGLGCLYFTIRHAREGRIAQLAIASLLAALVILTKQEFGVACLVLLGLEIASRFFIERSGRNLGTNALVFAAGLIPAAAGYSWFVWKLSAKVVFFDNWISTPGTYFMRTFAAHTMPLQGLRFDPHEIFWTAGQMALTLLFWFAFAAANAAAFQKWKSEPRIPVMVLFLDILIVGTVLTGWEVGKNRIFVFLAASPFPPGLYFAGVAFTLWAAWKFWRNPASHLALSGALLGTYASLTSLRVMMELRPSPYTYAVFFNTPVFLIFTILLVGLFRMAAKSLAPIPRSALASIVLAVQAGLLVLQIAPNPAALPAPFTTEFGTFYTRESIAILLPRIVSFMKGHTRNGKDILVLPEPPSLYVFAHMQAPTKWYSTMPGMVDPDHEQEFIDESKANDVRYVLLSNRTTDEYGVTSFGFGYNETIYHWIDTNFTKVEQFGPLPGSFPFPYIMYVYKRNDLLTAADRQAMAARSGMAAEAPEKHAQSATVANPGAGKVGAYGLQ